MRAVGAVVASCLALIAATASAQQTPADAQQPASTQQKPAAPPPTSKPPQMDPAAKRGVDFGPGSVVKSAREQLAAGHTDEAIDLAERVLVRIPTFTEAASVKIDALFALHKPDQAIETYEQWFKASGHEDPKLLADVARGVLRQIAATPTDLAASSALEALARAGDASARATLVKQAAAKDGASAALSTEALARLGDAKAIGELVTQASSDSPNASASALSMLGELREPRARGAVLKGLESNNMIVRVTAISAAGRLNVAEAKPALKKALTDHPYLLRLQAAVALRQLGDASGATVLADALGSELPDARLVAAQGLSRAAGADQAWIASVKPVLSNPDALYRFTAAELLLPYDRPAALGVLQKGASDPNPVVRTEVARIVAGDPKADLGSIRPFLKDSSPWARVHAAKRLSQATATNQAAATKGATNRETPKKSK